MGTTMNRRSYRRIIHEDLEWLRQAFNEYVKKHPNDPGSLEYTHIKTVLESSINEQYPRGNHTFYVASRMRHYKMWLEYFRKGALIVSSWIHEAHREEKRTKAEWVHRAELNIKEATEADILVFYAREDDQNWRGAWQEVGAALAAGKHVRVVKVGDPDLGEMLLPHPRVCVYDSLEEALNLEKEEETEENER